MDRRCRLTDTPFTVSDEDLAMLERLSPRVGDTVLPLPPPTLCPDERKRRRLAFRNERRLYHRTSTLSGKPIISIYSPDKPATVYSHEEWWSDRWDARSYGRDFDFRRPFFTQYAELLQVVPRMQLITSPDAAENNCLYINFAGNSRNCYMTFDSDFNEDSYHSTVLKHSRNCCDCSYVTQSELCYECVDCSSCYGLSWSQDCSNCSDSCFLNSCIGCRSCCLCVNLVQREYCIRNQQYSKAEYERIVTGFGLDRRGGVERARTELAALTAHHPRKYSRILKSENVTGDYIRNARNIHYSFNIGDAEDLRYCDSVYGAKDCMDVSSFGEHIEHVYESGTIGINCSELLFSFECVMNNANLIYGTECRQSRNSFGCVGLRNNEYCIFNKQYSSADYTALVPKIVSHMVRTGEWGEYFPLSLSSFGYNETVAHELFPLEKRRVVEMEGRWSDFEVSPPTVSVTEPKAVPDRAADAGDDILSQPIRCVETGKPFRLTKPELELYRQIGAPIPVVGPDARWNKRMALRNPQRLYERECAETGERLLSSYAPDRPEVVLGEAAYQRCLS